MVYRKLNLTCQWVRLFTLIIPLTNGITIPKTGARTSLNPTSLIFSGWRIGLVGDTLILVCLFSSFVRFYFYTVKINIRFDRITFQTINLTLYGIG